MNLTHAGDGLGHSWLVLARDGESSIALCKSQAFGTEDEANRLAQDLAKNNPGKMYYVAEMRRMVCARELAIVEYDAKWVERHTAMRTASALADDSRGLLHSGCSSGLNPYLDCSGVYWAGAIAQNFTEVTCIACLRVRANESISARNRLNELVT